MSGFPPSATPQWRQPALPRTLRSSSAAHQAPSEQQAWRRAVASAGPPLLLFPPGLRPQEAALAGPPVDLLAPLEPDIGDTDGSGAALGLESALYYSSDGGPSHPSRHARDTDGRTCALCGEVLRGGDASATLCNPCSRMDSWVGSLDDGGAAR